MTSINLEDTNLIAYYCVCQQACLISPYNLQRCPARAIDGAIAVQKDILQLDMAWDPKSAIT